MNVKQRRPRLRETALTRRFRKIIKIKLSETKEYSLDSCESSLRLLSNSKKSLLIRIPLAMFALMNLVICMFQVVNCILFYRSYPVVSDVTMKTDQGIVLSGTVCANDNKEFVQVANTDRPVCFNRILTYLEEPTGKIETLAEMWRLSNTRKSMSKVYGSINGQKNVSQFIKLTSEDLAYGRCLKWTSIDTVLPGSSVAVELAITRTGCMSTSMVTMQCNDGSSETNSMGLIPHGVKVTSLIKVKTYIVENRPGRPCVSDQEYEQCKLNCMKSKAMKSLNCTFPHMAYVPLPMCDPNQMSTIDQFGIVNKILLRTLPNSECGCFQKCTTSLLEGTTQYEQIDRHKVTFAMELQEPLVIIAERSFYDMIKLLSDIGGNLGLFLGLSVLSIADLMYNANSIFKNQIPKVTITKRDPLVKMVNKELEKMILEEQVIKRNLDNLNFKCVYKLVPMLLWGLWCYCSYNRLLYYLEYPVTVVIKLEFNDTIQYPNFILCNDNNGAQRLRSSFVKKQKTKKDYCQLDTYDVIDKHSVKTVWEKNSNLVQYTRKNDAIGGDSGQISQKIFHFDIRGKKTVLENITMVDGTCTRVRPVVRPYGGTTNTFILLSMLYSRCNFAEMMKVYVTTLNKNVWSWDFQNMWYIAKMNWQTYVTTIQEIRLESTPVNPCVDLIKAEECKWKCFENELQKQITCKLPFMPNTTQVPWCVNASAAKNARKIYQKLEMTLPERLKDCQCIRSCQDTIYVTKLSVENFSVMSELESIMLFILCGNQIEYWNEQRVYSAIKLCSEFGGMLGGLVGFSLLSLAGYMKLVRNYCKLNKKRA